MACSLCEGAPTSSFCDMRGGGLAAPLRDALVVKVRFQDSGTDQHGAQLPAWSNLIWFHLDLFAAMSKRAMLSRAILGDEVNRDPQANDFVCVGQWQRFPPPCIENISAV